MVSTLNVNMALNELKAFWRGKRTVTEQVSLQGPSACSNRVRRIVTSPPRCRATDRDSKHKGPSCIQPYFTFAKIDAAK